MPTTSRLFPTPLLRWRSYVGHQWRAGDRIVSLKDEFPNNLYFPRISQLAGLNLSEVLWDQFYESRRRAHAPGPHEHSKLFDRTATGPCRCFPPCCTPMVRSSTLTERRASARFEFRVPDVQPDMLAVHGYKWLLSPNGAGFMYVSPEFGAVIEPNVIGWRSDRRWRDVDQLHHGAPEFVDAAEKYEGGMLNFRPSTAWALRLT